MTVRSTTALSQVAALAAQSGARYVVVRQPDGDVKGVQLTTVASWMATQHPTVTAEQIPVVESFEVAVGTPVMDVLTLLADSTASVVLVPEPAMDRCRIIQRSLVEMTAGVHASGARRRTLAS